MHYLLIFLKQIWKIIHSLHTDFPYINVQYNSFTNVQENLLATHYTLIFPIKRKFGGNSEKNSGIFGGIFRAHHISNYLRQASQCTTC